MISSSESQFSSTARTTLPDLSNMGYAYHSIHQAILLGQKTGLAYVVRQYPRSVSLYLRAIWQLYTERGHRKYMKPSA